MGSQSGTMRGQADLLSRARLLLTETQQRLLASLAPLASEAAHTLLGNNAGGPAAPAALTVAQVLALLGIPVPIITEAASTLLGNDTGGPAAPAALTAAQVLALLALDQPATGADIVLSPLPLHPDCEISPGTDRASRYRIPAGTALGSAYIIYLNPTAGPPSAGDSVMLTCRALNLGYAVTVKSGTSLVPGATLGVFSASLPKPRMLMSYFDGTAWQFQQYDWLQT